MKIGMPPELQSTNIVKLMSYNCNYLLQNSSGILVYITNLLLYLQFIYMFNTFTPYMTRYSINCSEINLFLMVWEVLLNTREVLYARKEEVNTEMSSF